jgi:deoxyxylulose-5-phosphate synthase
MVLGMLFEDLALQYSAPDGHNIDQFSIFFEHRDYPWPVLVHVITPKGGLRIAECNPSQYRGTPPDPRAVRQRNSPS